MLPLTLPLPLRLICWRDQIDVTVHTNVVMHYTGHYIHQTVRGMHIGSPCVKTV